MALQKGAHIVAFIRRLARHFGSLDRDLRAYSPIIKQVVIVGAGPAGLLTALETVAAGQTARNSYSANITLLEKRKDYTRPTWFDINSKRTGGLGRSKLAQVFICLK